MAIVAPKVATRLLRAIALRQSFAQLWVPLPTMHLCRSLFLLLPLSLLLAACGRSSPSDCASPSAFRDSSGRNDEILRIRYQWLAVTGKLDSTLRNGPEMPLYLASRRSLDSNSLRYASRLSGQEGTLTDTAGCLDWQATWNAGEFDRAALVTAMVRTLIDSQVTVMEWTLRDSAKIPSLLHVQFTRPGPYAPMPDSLVLELFAKETRRRP